MSRRTRRRRAPAARTTQPAAPPPALPVVADPRPRRRALFRGPKITLTCDCGETRLLHYGERWQCEKCGRAWDTHKIPAEEFAVIKRIQHRFVLVPIVVLTTILTTVVLFVVFGRVYVFLLLPLTLTVWRTYGRTVHRRRLHKALERQTPWKITPD